MKMLERGRVAKLRRRRLHHSHKGLTRRITNKMDVKTGRNIDVAIGHVGDETHAFHSEVSVVLAGLILLCPQALKNSTGR